MGREIVAPRDSASVNALAHFASPGPLTEFGVHAAFARALPAALPDLCRVVQGLVLHPFMTGLYGLTPDLGRNNIELELRAAAEMLELALLDRLAALTLAGNDALGELLALQASEPGLRVPAVVQSAFLGGKSVKLAAGVAN